MSDKNYSPEVPDTYQLALNTINQLAGRLDGMTAMYKDEFRYRQMAEARVKTLEAQVEASTRWETGFRNIVTITIGARTEFEIKDVVEMVRSMRDGLNRLRSIPAVKLVLRLNPELKQALAAKEPANA